MTEHVTIVGTGAMGTVCALLLAHNGVSCTLWGRRRDHVDRLLQTRRNAEYLPDHPIPDSVQLAHIPAEAMHRATMLVSAVPCQYTRDIWMQIKPHVPAGVAVVSTAKGIEVDTLLRPSQVIRDVIGPSPVAVLSGPTIAPELAKRLPASIVAASDDAALADRVQALFNTSWLRVYTNADPIGVELAGAAKNVIALAAGILDGIHAGTNAKAAMATRGLLEMARLGVAMGAQTETYYGLAGVGDLITTAISPVGRNRSAGEKIGGGMAVDEVIRSTPSVIEGIPTTKSIIELARRHGVDMPITESVYAVLFEGLDPVSAVTQLMQRDARAE